MMGFAKAVSFLLSPIFTILPVFFVLVAKFSQDYSHALKWTIFSYAFIITIVLFIIIGVVLGFFSNFNVSKREQRPLLFSFTAFAMFCYLISLLIFNAPKVLFIAFFAVALCLIFIIVVNKWIKASIHLAFFTAAALFIGIAYGRYFLLPLIFVPLLVWSRVKLKEHTLAETIVGSILGIVVTLIVYLISRQFFLGWIYS